MTQVTRKGADTREAAVEIGLSMWPDVSLRRVAQELNITHPALLHHFKSAAAFKDAIAAYAIEKRDTRVIKSLIVHEHPAVAHWDKPTRAAWLAA